MAQSSILKLYSRLNIKVICSVFILVTFIITDNKSEKKLFKQKWPKADPNDRAQDLDISAYVNLLGDLLLVAGHLGEGLLHLLRDGLVLLLLRHQLVLQPVHLKKKRFFSTNLKESFQSDSPPPSAASSRTSRQTQRAPPPASAWPSTSWSTPCRSSPSGSPSPQPPEEYGVSWQSVVKFEGTSRDLRLLATTLNSSSSSRILVSPTSARSSAFSSSDSQVASFFATW